MAHFLWLDSTLSWAGSSKMEGLHLGKLRVNNVVKHLKRDCHSNCKIWAKRPTIWGFSISIHLVFLKYLWNSCRSKVTTRVQSLLMNSPPLINYFHLGISEENIDRLCFLNPTKSIKSLSVSSLSDACISPQRDHVASSKKRGNRSIHFCWCIFYNLSFCI